MLPRFLERGAGNSLRIPGHPVKNLCSGPVVTPGESGGILRGLRTRTDTTGETSHLAANTIERPLLRRLFGFGHAFESRDPGNQLANFDDAATLLEEG
jgi:hypothetical protein